MDGPTTSALINASGWALSTVLGAAAGAYTSRRMRKAQAVDLETTVAERVVKLQETERAQLARRVEELEAEVAALKARYERELEQLRGERDALRVEVGQLHMQLVAKQAELDAARREIADLHAVALVQATPMTPGTSTTGGG